jgi:hypothetical protein
VSPAFGLLVKSVSPNASLPGSKHPVANELGRRLDDALRARLEAVEEEVRIFRDAKYQEYEHFRERARHDLGTILR